MISWILALALSIPGVASAEECAATVTPEQLAATLEAAESAWRSADDDGFLLKMEEAHLQLPCVDAAVSPDLAARYHRDAGLWLYVSGQRDRTAQAFSAARRIEPAHSIPASLLPPKHPIRGLFDSAPTAAATEPTPRAADGALTFDGSEGDRPSDSPTIAQLTRVDGTMSFTTYLRPGDALPMYAVVKAPVKTGGLAEHRLGIALAVGSGALLAGGTTFALIARSTQQEFLESPPEGFTALDELYQRNRTASTTSALLLGLGGAAGVGAVFAW